MLKAGLPGMSLSSRLTSPIRRETFDAAEAPPQLGKAPQRWSREINAVWDKLASPRYGRTSVGGRRSQHAARASWPGAAAAVWAAATIFAAHIRDATHEEIGLANAADEKFPASGRAPHFKEFPAPMPPRRPASKKMIWKGIEQCCRWQLSANAQVAQLAIQPSLQYAEELSLLVISAHRTASRNTVMHVDTF
jgi:hypothetical protein